MEARFKLTSRWFRILILSLFVSINVSTFAETESIPECGKVDEALVGKDGRAAVPWAATIFYQSTLCDFRQASHGHGVIIGPTTILMSGYFLWATTNRGSAKLQEFKTSHFMVAVGLKSKQPVNADLHTQFMKVSHIRIHQRSYEKYSEHDFALIHLKNPIRFSSYVRPICLDNSPEASLIDVNSTYKLGELSISGFRRGQLDIEPFGLLDKTTCTTKLESDFKDSNQASGLQSSGVPCGLSSKSREDVQGWSGYGNGLIQSRSLDFAQIARVTNNQIFPNICYQKGSSIVTLQNNRWYLIGITSESLGTGCANNVYFVSFVTLKDNLEWILKNVWYSKQEFVCDNGQTIDLGFRVCNGFQDCEDGSDENESYCTAIKCGSYFSMFCSRCEEKESFKILNQNYNFSKSTSSEEIKCPALKQTEGTLLHCENPTIRARISCAYGSDPGTKAIFQCKNAKRNEPSSYCVITCKTDGTWTDELKSYVCQSDQNIKPNQTQDNLLDSVAIIFGDRRNLTSWINTILQSINKTDNIDDVSLENWSPSLSLSPSIADKTGIGLSNSTGPQNCRGFKKKTGMKITCRAPGSSKLTDCTEPAEPGTKAEFGCDLYYRPIFSAAAVIKTCQSNGRWSLENRAFECRLDCGVPKSALIGHIVNGKVSEGAKWPWHGVLFRKTKEGIFQYICGATLISKRLLLTAGHCVTNRNGKALPLDHFILVLGATSNILEENNGDPHSQIMKLSNITINQAFNLASFESDIALIRLERASNITDFVRPSCFPSTLTSHNELLHLSPGSKGNIIGFGYDETGTPSNKLREAVLPVVSYSECYQVLKVQASSTMYCAGFTNGTAACNGDSGGGMFFEDEAHPRRMYLQGIVSHGNRDKTTGLCDHNQYSVFTRVGSFKNWIYEVGLELDDEF